MAASTRTSTGVGRTPPTRSISRSCRTRSSLAWRSSRREPISSRKTVPPWASSNLPSLRATAPVKAPLLVAEQLRLDEGLGNRRDVDGDERLGAARTLMVDGPRHQLLARPALARDEHGGRRPRDLGHELVDADHGAVPPDHGPRSAPLVAGQGQLGAQTEHLALQRPLLEGPVHEQRDVVDVEGLGEVVVRAALERLHGRADLVHRGDQRHHDAGVEGLDAREDVETRLPRACAGRA